MLPEPPVFISWYVTSRVVTYWSSGDFDSLFVFIYLSKCIHVDMLMSRVTKRIFVELSSLCQQKITMLIWTV
jgi:hypothetical protein